MKPATVLSVCIATVALCCLGGPVLAQRRQLDAAADQLFQAGKFTAARALYARTVARDPKYEPAILQLGRIALLANRLDQAEAWFKKTLVLQPNNADAKVMLAEARYRRDDFQGAVAALNGVDVGTNQLVASQYPTLNVAKLKSFKGQTPYKLDGPGAMTRVKLLRTEPLPIVNVRVNGGREVTFFIDTGGSEVALDTEFAKELGIPQFGTVQGTFSGGQHASVGQGRIDSLGIGRWTIRNLPVAMLALRQLSTDLGVKQIDGVLGTTLFYHFLTTLDFKHGELVLRRKTPQNLAGFIASAGKKFVSPIWIASDHFMVGWGQVQTLPPTLLFIDTGLQGAGIKLAEPVIGQAGIELDESKASAGAGGGGTLRVVPYTVTRLSFGGITETNVPGLYDGPFPWESMFGFHLAGMVGHDFFAPYAVTFDFAHMRLFLQ